jgi:hypothetical protein
MPRRAEALHCNRAQNPRRDHSRRDGVRLVTATLPDGDVVQLLRQTESLLHLGLRTKTLVDLTPPSSEPRAGLPRIARFASRSPA